MLAYWEKDGSVSVLPSDKVTSDTKGFGASCRVRLGKTEYTVRITGTGKSFYCFVVQVSMSITPGNKRDMEALEEKYISGTYDPFNIAAAADDGGGASTTPVDDGDGAPGGTRRGRKRSAG